MSQPEASKFNRRHFLSGTTALGAAAILGWPENSRAKPPPETKKIRIVRAAAICLAPQFLAEELLRLEGFSEINYINATTGNLCDALEDGTADVTMEPAPARAIVKCCVRLVDQAAIFCDCSRTPFLNATP